MQKFKYKKSGGIAMQTYQPMTNYGPYQPMPQPYADRLTQLQNQYNQAVNVPQMQTVPQQQVNQGLLWVSGEVGAKSYLVAPNSTVLLMDSDAQRFYLKSADNAGMPSLRIFEYSEITNAPQNVPQALNTDFKELDSKYVKREEYECLKRQYESIMERLDSMVSNTESVEPSAKPKSRRGGSGNNEQSDI